MSVEMSQSPEFREAVAFRGDWPREKAHKERFNPRPWFTYASPLEHYLYDFRELFEPADVTIAAGALKAVAKQSKFKTVLDIGADTTVIDELVREYGYKKGVAVSLGRTKLEDSSGMDTEQITGDLLPTDRSGSTFSQIQSYIEGNGLKGFDLVISRMLAGTNEGFITDHPIVHAWLLEQVWRCMNPDGSLGLLQIPIIYDNDHQLGRLRNLTLRRLRRAGIYCSMTGNDTLQTSIRIERNSDGPDTIAPIIVPHLFRGQNQSAVPTR